jgi:hypothetical protein
MWTRWATVTVAGSMLASLVACAESSHQTQRMATLSLAPENGYADVYDPASPFFYSPGFWWSPFGYYPGYYGYGPGYRSGYPYPGYYYDRPNSGPSGPGSSSPPANAPPQFFKRKD